MDVGEFVARFEEHGPVVKPLKRRVEFGVGERAVWVTFEAIRDMDGEYLEGVVHVALEEFSKLEGI